MDQVLTPDSAHEYAPEQPPTICVACRQQIHGGATVCRYCRAPQATSRIRAVGDGFKWIAGGVTAVSLLGAIHGLWDVYGQWRNARDALRENLVAAELLSEDGNFIQAWAMHELALELAPASLEVRGRQADLAMRWLRETETPDRMGFAALADQTEPALYRGLVGADGRRSADILSHIALAAYLRGLETREHGEEKALLEQALAADADNVYANVLMGFWTVYDADDKAAAMTGASGRFDRALASTDDRAWVREWQLLAYHNALDRSGLEAEERVALGRALLVAADSMRTDGEPAPTGRTRRVILDVHGGSRHQGEYVEGLLNALPADRYLATIGWLTEAEDLDRDPQSCFVLARLYEEQGATDEAVAIYRTLSEQPDGVSNNDFNVRVDDAVLRLTGEPTARALERGKRKYLNDPISEGVDAWEFHAETLLNFDPQWRGRNFTAAIAFFDPTQPGSPSRMRPDEALVVLKDARERLRAWLDPREAQWAEHGFQLINDEANARIARASLSDIWWTIASISMAAERWDAAIAELGDLLTRSGDESAGVHYDLACSYSRRAQSYPDTAIGDTKRVADVELALAEVRAAVDGWKGAGEPVDWAHIKRDSDLEAVRATPTYATLVAGR
ncbi:MAG: hypothetical protein E4H03_07870 [Myxococcales bacterium]|nr:MAG: hypothetical protein E4H03_07870 [Myxococcales bacterium]